MSEIEDTTPSGLLYAKLKDSDCGKKVYIGREDPIGLYNHAIKQFNFISNRATEGTYEKLNTNSFYSFWMLRWWTLSRADSNCFFLIISFIFNFLLALIPIFNLLLMIIWLIVYLIYERTQKIHTNTNKPLCADPFKSMVHNDKVCKKAGLLNMYFEVTLNQLSGIGLRESQIEVIKSNRVGGVVTFMMYSDRFKNGFAKFGFLRWVHILHIIFCACAIVLANLYVYPRFKINEFFQST